MNDLMKFILKTNYCRYMRYEKVMNLREYFEVFYTEAAELVFSAAVNKQWPIQRFLDFVNETIKELSQEDEEAEA